MFNSFVLSFVVHRAAFKFCQGLLEASRRGVAPNPNEWMEHASLAVGFEDTGKLLEAISEYQKAVKLSNGDQDGTASLAHAYARIGRRSEAQRRQAGKW